jgi:hypothetical protein
MERITVKQFFVPAGHETNLLKEMKEKSPRDVAELMLNLDNATRSACRTCGGDESTIRLHTTGRYENAIGFKFEYFRPGDLVMVFDRPETDAEFNYRAASIAKDLEDKARYERNERATVARNIKKMEARLATMKAKVSK